MLQEKQFFLSCLENGPVALRKISGRMRDRFDTSPAGIKDVLLMEGLIQLSHSKREGAMQKMNHYFKLTGKKLNEQEPVKKPAVSEKWEDGTVKSKGNAFDWANKPCTLFNKSELAQMKQKYHNNNPITIYSRA
jgi:hypothetical protein